MTRVLLVIERDADFESQSVASQLLCRSDFGLTCDPFELPPAGATPAAIRRIASLHRRQEFDVLHAFGPRALLAVATVGCCPIVYSPPSDEPARKLCRLRWITSFRDVTVVCTSGAAGLEIAHAGYSPGRCRVIPPAATPTAGRLSRSELGINPDDRVLLAIGESTRAARHTLAIWVAVILHFLDRRYRLRLWGRGPQSQRLQRFADSLRQPELCVFAEQRLGRCVPWGELARMADLAIFTARRATAALPTAICQLMSVPVVNASFGSILAAELVEASEPFLRVQSNRPREIARDIHHWLNDRSVLHPAESAARDHAARRYDAREVKMQWARFYKDVVVGRRWPAPGWDGAGSSAAPLSPGWRL